MIEFFPFNIIPMKSFKDFFAVFQYIGVVKVCLYCFCNRKSFGTIFEEKRISSRPQISILLRYDLSIKHFLLFLTGYGSADPGRASGGQNSLGGYR